MPMISTDVYKRQAQEIEEECKKEIDTLKKDGGFILATGCEYPANASVDYARLMVKTAQTYGRY